LTGVGGWLDSSGSLRIGIRAIDNGLPGTPLYSADKTTTQYPANWQVFLTWKLGAGNYPPIQVFGDLTPASSDVPEPSSIALTGLAIAALAAARRRRA